MGRGSLEELEDVPPPCAHCAHWPSCPLYMRFSSRVVSRTSNLSRTVIEEWGGLAPCATSSAPYSVLPLLIARRGFYRTDTTA